MGKTDTETTKGIFKSQISAAAAEVGLQKQNQSMFILKIANRK